MQYLSETISFLAGGTVGFVIRGVINIGNRRNSPDVRQDHNQVGGHQAGRDLNIGTAPEKPKAGKRE